MNKQLCPLSAIRGSQRATDGVTGKAATRSFKVGSKNGRQGKWILFPCHRNSKAVRQKHTLAI
ncbi:Hypothetical predicted protein [Podarcis lilfordi]|uniref:Uncharacterized protein n=1 Tax=Podarcis lilfordi TaxID=74358 RepID=A0AA35KTI6_9SAUR|nr:Hypothetical predicted protein [Podarcis lilfordi]